MHEPRLLPISALQHLIFCPRQCALIHLEGLWAENRLTMEGRLMHTTAHAENTGPRGGGRAESRPGVRIVRGLALVNESLGLIGKADIVEFHEQKPGAAADGSPGAVPFPIEYKRGRPKPHDADKVQLCAQALCLEEMLALPPGGVPAGAIYYGRTRRRQDVPFDDGLRRRTHDTIRALHQMIDAGVTPRASREKKCDRCSLVNLCLPDATGPSRSARRYLNVIV